MSRSAEPISSEPAPQVPPQPLAPVAPRPVRDARYDWAAERTLLAWVRTGLAMMGFGFVVARFGAFLRAIGFTAPGAFQDEGQASASMGVGVLMVAFGVAANLVAVRRFLSNHRALTRGEPIDPSPAGPAALAIFAAVLGGVLTLLLGGALLR